MPRAEHTSLPSHSTSGLPKGDRSTRKLRAAAAGPAHRAIERGVTEGAGREADRRVAFVAEQGSERCGHAQAPRAFFVDVGPDSRGSKR